jgi:DNA-binding IclR family transcriptional regulator
VEFFSEVIVIHHEPRPDGSRQMPETGLTIPAHASALGKVLLAYQSRFHEAVLAKGPLRSLTGETLTDPDELAKELAEVLASGYAVEDEEAVLGEASIAVPVADRDGEVVAAIAVVMPASEDPLPGSILTLLRETARNVSRELGAPGWPPHAAARES